MSRSSVKLQPINGNAGDQSGMPNTIDTKGIVGHTESWAI